MGVGEDFRGFCGELTINNRASISDRYEQITRRLNLEFRDSESKTNNSFYVGSFGRGTAIRGFSDLDMIYVLPVDVYHQHDKYAGNGQSALLQRVRNAVLKTYSGTAIGADGQVVAVSFSDGMVFEVVPAFLGKDDKYIFPNANDGGSWQVTDPKPEIKAIAALDDECNGNLTNLCRMARAWKSTWNVPMGGLLIDTLAHRFLREWQYRKQAFAFYDWMSRDFFQYLGDEPERDRWSAAGSGQWIPSRGKFQYKALRCKNLADQAIAHATAEQTWSARQRWREIYGFAYPS